MTFLRNTSTHERARSSKVGSDTSPGSCEPAFTSAVACTLSALKIISSRHPFLEEWEAAFCTVILKLLEMRRALQYPSHSAVSESQVGMLRPHPASTEGTRGGSGGNQNQQDRGKKRMYAKPFSATIAFAT